MASASPKGIKMVPQVVGVTLNLSTEEAAELMELLFVHRVKPKLGSVCRALEDVFMNVKEIK